MDQATTKTLKSVHFPPYDYSAPHSLYALSKFTEIVLGPKRVYFKIVLRTAHEVQNVVGGRM